MGSPTELSSPFEYTVWWIVLGWILLGLIVAWYAYVFFITRKKKVRSLNTLGPRPYTPPDISSLQAKYTTLINEVESAYNSGSITIRIAHQKLSYLLRFFAYEVHGHRVDTLTLSDLKRSRYDTLTQAVQTLYIPEFKRGESGDVASACTQAREVVSTWKS